VPRPIGWLLVAVTFALGAGCASTHTVRPLRRGNPIAHASLGGPLVNVGSFGAALAIDLASLVTPAVLITKSAFTSVAALVADGAYVDLPRSFVADSAWDNLRKVPGVAAPYLALHGGADPYVQPRHSIELVNAHDAAGYPSQLTLVPRADHGNLPETMGLDGRCCRRHEPH
jgi:fermentation-respiration switch protein FrsA (DUF1100 family)